MHLYEVCIELQIGEHSKCFTEYFIARTDRDANKIAHECMREKAYHDKLRKDKYSDWYYPPTDEYALRIRYYRISPMINFKNFSIVASNLSFKPDNVYNPSVYVMFKVHEDKEGVTRFANGDEVKPAYGMTEEHYRTFQFYINFLLGKHL